MLECSAATTSKKNIALDATYHAMNANTLRFTALNAVQITILYQLPELENAFYYLAFQHQIKYAIFALHTAVNAIHLVTALNVKMDICLMKTLAFLV